MKTKYHLLQLIQTLYEDRYDERMPYNMYQLYKNMKTKTLNTLYNNETLFKGEKQDEGYKNTYS